MVARTSFAAREHVVRTHDSKVSSNDDDEKATNDECPAVRIVIIKHEAESNVGKDESFSCISESLDCNA